MHLRDERRLTITTIKGYRAAIASVQSRVGTNGYLTSLFRSFTVAAPPSQPLPRWYLDVVLRYLRSPVFEPLGDLNFRRLSAKTLFLLSLATAKRVSEIHAVSRSVGWRDGSAVLSYVPSFRAKTETVARPLPRHFVVPDLATLVPGEVERFQCPVRALKYYLRHTEALRGPSDHLFCAIGAPHLPLKKSFVSKLIKEVIIEAHREVDRRDLPIMKIKAHDVRGVSASLAAYRGVPTARILDAACWRTPSVFVGRYLKGVAVTYGDISSLGPLVAAGQLLDST